MIDVNYQDLYDENGFIHDKNGKVINIMNKSDKEIEKYIERYG